MKYLNQEIKHNFIDNLKSLFTHFLKFKNRMKNCLLIFRNLNTYKKYLIIFKFQGIFRNNIYVLKKCFSLMWYWYIYFFYVKLKRSNKIWLRTISYMHFILSLYQDYLINNDILELIIYFYPSLVARVKLYLSYRTS